MRESYEQAVARSARHGSATPLPPEAVEPWLCDFLGWSPLQLSEMDYAEVMAYLGWAEGKALAEWSQSSRPQVEVDQQRLAAVRAGRH